MWRLRVLTGKASGSEYAFDVGSDFRIGRAKEKVDALLDDSGVSAVHARLIAREADVAITDLHSANGTFLNGERATFHLATEGDRVFFGHVVGRLERGEPAREAIVIANAPKQKAPYARLDCVILRPFAGDLHDVTLAEVLRLFAASKKTGVLWVWPEGEKEHRIAFAQGSIVGVRRADSAVDDPIATLRAGLAWKGGMFDVVPPTDDDFRLEPISVDAVLDQA